MLAGRIFRGLSSMVELQGLALCVGSIPATPTNQVRRNSCESMVFAASKRFDCVVCHYGVYPIRWCPGRVHGRFGFVGVS